jgi:hypothetical protein
MNPLGLVDIFVGNILGDVGVPMVSKFGTDIPKWNAKVPHYVDFIFIFVDKFLSRIGVVLLFHSYDLQVFR